MDYVRPSGWSLTRTWDPSNFYYLFLLSVLLLLLIYCTYIYTVVCNSFSYFRFYPGYPSVEICWAAMWVFLTHESSAIRPCFVFHRPCFSISSPWRSWSPARPVPTHVFPTFWCGYGSIPINTIFSGMNIHKSQLLWCSPGVQGFDTLPCFNMFQLEALERRSGPTAAGCFAAGSGLGHARRFGKMWHMALSAARHCPFFWAHII